MLMEVVDRFWYRWLCSQCKRITKDFLLEMKCCTIDGKRFEDFMLKL